MSHQKKLSRLKEISSIPELLKIIGYKNFIHAIIEKYPLPPIAGFSSHRWTEELLYKYIYLYFDISKFKDKADIPLPAFNTIRDALHYPPIKYPYIISPFKFSYKWLFSYYIKKIRQSSCLTESKIPVKRPNCRIFSIYSFIF